MIPSFTNPFRYVPHPLVRKAAGMVMADLDAMISDGKLPEAVCRGFAEGKMLGVLVCIPRGAKTLTSLRGAETLTSLRGAERRGNLLYLAAFSGSVGGRSIVEGFVPPVFDLLDPSGHFKEKEAEISELNREIGRMESCEELTVLRAQLSEAERERDKELSQVRCSMSAAKKDREKRRSEGCSHEAEEAMIRESQHEKAEFRRLKMHWEDRIADVRGRISTWESDISRLKKQRAMMSDALQEWIFRQYIVHNALGDEISIYDLFASQGLTPPGGTGDCAAPKLLEYAFRHGLEPVAMGEFWYGTSPDTAVRTHGHFYPSCTSKCGPLLGFMLKGLDISSAGAICPEPSVIYEDEDIIVLDKPSGMPSVPGLNGMESAQEWLQRRLGGRSAEDSSVHAVHRLDMDTSGILLFARTPEAAVDIRRQFEERTVRKTYRARLSAGGHELKVGDKGRIELPLSPDYDERPRQKVDFRQGKEAVTDYEVTAVHADGTTDVLFHPVTGRTHQLRVHAAHHLGLGRPIVGDLLYGAHTIDSPSRTAGRLCLHAAEISFIHPVSGRQIECVAKAAHSIL